MPDHPQLPKPARSFTLDPAIFWETVDLYKDYDYAFGPDHTPSELAHPGYPGSLLALGANHSAGGFSTKIKLVDADADAPTNYRKHKYTNCCMFVEGVLVGAALKEHGAQFGLSWTLPHHKATMNTANDLNVQGAVAAFYLAGLTDPPLRLDEKTTLAPDTIYVVQGGHHVWLIVDYRDGHCLRLEANFSDPKYRPEFGGTDFYGGVAYAGLGRVPHDRDNWHRHLGNDNPYTWTRLRAKLLEDLRKSPDLVMIARVRIGEPTDPRHVSFPFEPASAPGVTAAAAYALNETYKHGFFPLGGYKNIHSGVHFPLPLKNPFAPTTEIPTPPPGLEPVYCMADGALVAARLPHASPRADTTKSSNGLVLIRHDLEELDAVGPSQRFVLYSLYLHLESPDWPSRATPKAKGTPNPYAAVPWMNALVMPKNGGVVGVDPNNTGTFARRFFAADPTTDDLLKLPNTTAKVLDPDFATRKVRSFVPPKTRPTYPASVVAVKRGPEPRYTRAYEVLTDPAYKLLTLADRPQQVSRGELLGYVKSGKYLHWEILAVPSGGASALTSLLEHAHRVLSKRHAKRAFPRVDEITDDNILQPDELTALLKELPDVIKRRDRLFNADGEPSYNDTELGINLRNPTPIPFALPPRNDTSGLWYDVTVAITVHTIKVTEEHGTRAVPTWAGEVKLDLWFEGIDDFARPAPYSVTAVVHDGVATAQIRVPASARNVKVHPATVGYTVKQGAVSAEPARILDEKKARVRQLQSLTETRWRDVVVQHCNEWTADGLQRSLTERVTDPKVDRVLAWWNEQEAPADPDKPLFGKEVAAEAEWLHNANPITIAWVIELLIREKKLAFRPPDPPSGRTPLAPLFAGWVPVEAAEHPFPVGARLVHAISVAPREDYADALEFKARIGSREYDLTSTSYVDGVAAIQPIAPLWGRVELVLKRKGGPILTATLGGRTGIDFAVPVLAGAPPDANDRQEVELLQPPFAPTKAHGKWHLLVPWATNRPDIIRGWIILQTRHGGQDYKTSNLRIPVTTTPLGRKKKAAPSISRDGYITAPNKLLRRPFTFQDFQKAGASQVSGALVHLLRLLHAHAPFTLKSVDKDGHHATLQCSPKKMQILADLAAKYARVERVDELLKVTVTAADFSEVDFNPTTALRKLLERATAADGETEVRFGVLFVQGHAPLSSQLDDTNFKDLLDLPHRCGWSSKPNEWFQWPRIGPIQVKPIRADKGWTLQISAELLGGTPEFWRRAAPTFRKSGAGGVLSPSSISKDSLSANLRFNDRDLEKQITLGVKVKNKASYLGLQIAPGNVDTPAEKPHTLKKP